MLRKLVSPNIQTMKKGFQVESVEFVTIEQPWNWQKTRYPDNPDKRISSLPVRSPSIPFWSQYDGWNFNFTVVFDSKKEKKKETKGTHPDMEFSLRDRSIRAARHYRNCTVSIHDYLLEGRSTDVRETRFARNSVHDPVNVLPCSSTRGQQESSFAYVSPLMSSVTTNTRHTLSRMTVDRKTCSFSAATVSRPRERPPSSPIYPLFSSPCLLFLTISALGCPARTCVTSDSLPA